MVCRLQPETGSYHLRTVGEKKSFDFLKKFAIEINSKRCNLDRMLVGYGFIKVSGWRVKPFAIVLDWYGNRMWRRFFYDHWVALIVHYLTIANLHVLDIAPIRVHESITSTARLDSGDFLDGVVVRVSRLLQVTKEHVLLAKAMVAALPGLKSGANVLTAALCLLPELFNCVEVLTPFLFEFIHCFCCLHCLEGISCCGEFHSCWLQWVDAHW